MCLIVRHGSCLHSNNNAQYLVLAAETWVFFTVYVTRDYSFEAVNLLFYYCSQNNRVCDKICVIIKLMPGLGQRLLF